MGGAQSELLLAIKQDLEGENEIPGNARCILLPSPYSTLTAFSPESPNELQAKWLFPK